MSVETDIAMMLAIILSPDPPGGGRCGDHAISRGVLGLSFQGPRGSGASRAGPRNLVPVLFSVKEILDLFRGSFGTVVSGEP